jgi:8-oxo-dGTP pyrophosphatase MutT (NUDIX family)
LILIQTPAIGAARVLCHKRADNGWWGLPGGRQELGESIVECAIREMEEETGLKVEILGATSIDSDPYRYAICQYPDGGCVQYTNVTFLAHYISGELRVSEESLFLRWCDTGDLPKPFLPAHLWRLEQALLHDGQYLSIR